MKKDNRGMSLVELIIVMAIMSVLVGAVGFGISLISGKAAEKCANKLKISIQNNRVTTMAKEEASLELYVAADGAIIMKETINPGKPDEIIKEAQIGEPGVTVEYRITGDAADSYRLLGSAPLRISFNRSSGAFEPINNDINNKQYCLEIKVSKGSKSFCLKFAYLTGKISMERQS